MFAIYIAVCISLLLSPSYGACTEIVDGWTESYCPEDVNRIEIQIPMDEAQLNGDTVNEIDAFLQWMVDNLQEGVYKNYFRLRTEKIKKYYRTVKEIDISKSKKAGATGGITAPRASGIKYRRSFGNFVEEDSVLKYQNDLTMENAMSTPGSDIDMNGVIAVPPYDDVEGSKLEANVQVDTCTEGGLSAANFTYGAFGTGFSFKLEFDDEDAYGTNDSNALDMIDTSNWPLAADGDGSFFCDCATESCICCDVEEYIVDYCSFYNDDVTKVEKEFNYLGDTIHYILDIDFYWHKDGNMTSDETSEGKFTFQVKYEDEAAYLADFPSDSSTELSMKLYKKDTIDGEWHNLIEFAEGMVDLLSSRYSGSAQWIDHSMCTSETDCCTNLASTTDRWISTCSGFETQNECERRTAASGENQCQWIPCDEVGDCEWSGVGPARLATRCARLTTKDDCESSFSGRCNWMLRSNASSAAAVHVAYAELEAIVEETVKHTHKPKSWVYIGSMTLLFNGIAYLLLYVGYIRFSTWKKNGYAAALKQFEAEIENQFDEELSDGTDIEENEDLLNNM